MKKIAMVSTWLIPCGVGLYTESLVNSLSKIAKVKVFAEKLIPPQVENPPLDSFIKVDYERCWVRGNGYANLQEKILEYKPDICHIQFVAGIFGSLDYQLNSPFQQFVANLRNAGIEIVMTLHDIPHRTPGSDELTQWYKNLKAKFIIMNTNMSAGLREWYPDSDINLIPLGTPMFTPIEKSIARKQLGLKEEDFIMSQIGFYGVDKDMLGIVKAIPNINIPNFKLIFAGGFHPLASPIHRPHVRECMISAMQNKITNKVIFINKILSEEEINLYASASDFLILNQDMIFGSSTSASAHRILCAGKPIVMSLSPKLGEFLHNIHCIKTSPDKIAETVNKLYIDKELQKKLSSTIVDYAKKTSFDVIAEKHLGVYNK
jgi:glycosyltransferase involved in cell wall biosynthesis